MKLVTVLNLILSLCLLILSCNDRRVQQHFLNYKVSGEEGMDDVTVHISFTGGGRDDRTILLPNAAKIELDGEILQPDSTEFMGVYYEVQKRLDSFIGKHQIVYTDENGQKYTEEFEFVPLRLAHELPDTLNMGDLEFQFTGIEPTEKIRVLLIDTAFHTDDINEVMAVNDGKLIIPQSALRANVEPGPIYIEFHKDIERPVREAPERGGRFLLNYKLKRQLELKQ